MSKLSTRASPTSSFGASASLRGPPMMPLVARTFASRRSPPCSGAALRAAVIASAVHMSCASSCQREIERARGGVNFVHSAVYRGDSPEEKRTEGTTGTKETRRLALAHQVQGFADDVRRRQAVL